MPVRIRRVGKGKVRVTTPGGVKSKATTPEKADAQERILNEAKKKKKASKSNRA